MKYIICFSILVFLSIAVAAQTDVYERHKKRVAADGWIFMDEKKMFLKQGADEYGIFKVEAGKRYKIFCMSDDGDVRDTDVWVYDLKTKELLGKDTEKDLMAIVDISDGIARSVEIVGKNVKSNNPGHESRFYILITYKLL